MDQDCVQKCSNCSTHFMHTGSRPTLFKWKEYQLCYDCYVTPAIQNEIGSAIRVLQSYLVHTGKCHCRQCNVTVVDSLQCAMHKNYNFARNGITIPVLEQVYQGRSIQNILKLVDNSHIYCESCYSFCLAFPNYLK